MSERVRGRGEEQHILAVLGAIELLRHEFAIPGQDRFWFRDRGDLAESFPAEPLSDFGQVIRSVRVALANASTERCSPHSAIRSAGGVAD